MFEIRIIFGLALTLVLTALFLLWQSVVAKRRKVNGLKRMQETLERFDPMAQLSPKTPSAMAGLPPALENRLQQAGISPDKRLYAGLSAGGLVLALIGGFLSGFTGAAIALLAVYPLLLFGLLKWRTGVYRARVEAMLPDFLNAVVRVLSVGCSLDMAFRNASEECDEPLKGVFSQVLLRTQAGMALEDALSQVAEVAGIKEIRFVAAVFYLGIHYGGNAQAILERVTTSMRERARSQKELQAMTGETRASAAILSALPILVGSLILVSNPDYLLNMWHDATGRNLLMGAFGLQVAGMVLLFRMARIR